MSERRYLDPVTTSMREERTLIEFAKKLERSFGKFFRLGVLTFCRVMVETSTMPKDLEVEFKAISERDADYIKNLIEERISSDTEEIDMANQVKMPPKPNINWGTIPEDLKVSKYIQTIMIPSDRRDWIEKYLETRIKDDLGDTEGAFEVAEQFAKLVYAVYKQEKPEQIIITDLSQIRQVLMVWADSVKGAS